jgi:hypothetical protein
VLLAVTFFAFGNSTVRAKTGKVYLCRLASVSAQLLMQHMAYATNEIREMLASV